MRLALDDGGMVAGLGRLNSGLLARRSGTQTNQIEIRSRPHALQPCNAAYVRNLIEHGTTIIRKHAELLEHRILDHDFLGQ